MNLLLITLGCGLLLIFAIFVYLGDKKAEPYRCPECKNTVNTIRPVGGGYKYYCSTCDKIGDYR